MPLIREIIAAIEEVAPRSLQESYDNCGVQTGATGTECTGVLIAVDATPAVIAEAVETGCNLVVTHHPVIFKALKRLTGATLNERTVMAAIRAGVTVYACHTSLDNTPGRGTSFEMARMLGLADVTTLAPGNGDVEKLTVFCPAGYCDAVERAMWQAGAGHIGNYDCCSFQGEGIGSYRPLAGSRPWTGTPGELHREAERRLEVIVPRWRLGAVVAAMKAAHPYEVPAWESVAVTTGQPLSGLGAVGNLPTPLTAGELVERVKRTFGSPVARCSAADMSMSVGRVAMTGGSGSSLIDAAVASGAQAYITSDTGYHVFEERAEDIFIIDIGHYESEECTKMIFYHIVTEKFPNFAVRKSLKEKNPIQYL